MKYQNKMQKVSRQSQLNRAVGINAVRLADDGLKKKLAFYRKKYIEVKNQIQKRYGQKAKAVAKSRK